MSVQTTDNLGLERYTEHPWQDVSYAWEHPSSSQENTKIANADGFACCKKYVSNPTNTREEDQHVASLLDAVCYPSREYGDKKRQEVGRRRETLGINRGETHLIENRGKKDWQRREADITAEVHELCSISKSTTKRSCRLLTAVNQHFASRNARPTSFHTTLPIRLTSPTCLTRLAFAISLSSSFRNLAFSGTSGRKKNATGAMRIVGRPSTKNSSLQLARCECPDVIP